MKIKPITAEDVRGGGVEVDFPLDSVLWFWEGKVQERIVEHLVKKEYQISRYANTKSRESGKDIEAIAPEGQVLLTGPSFCTTANERVYITAMGCELGFGGPRGLQAAGAGGL